MMNIKSFIDRLIPDPNVQIDTLDFILAIIALIEALLAEPGS